MPFSDTHRRRLVLSSDGEALRAADPRFAASIERIPAVLPLPSQAMRVGGIRAVSPDRVFRHAPVFGSEAVDF
jgi:hypothetical protein